MADLSVLLTASDRHELRFRIVQFLRWEVAEWSWLAYGRKYRPFGLDAQHWAKALSRQSPQFRHMTSLAQTLVGQPSSGRAARGQCFGRGFLAKHP